MAAYFNVHTTRKAIVGLLDRFSNFIVEKYDDLGAVRRTVKIPIQFGTKEKFLQIIDNVNLNTDLNIPTGNAEMDIFLPRIGVNLISMVYDSQRHTARTAKIQTQVSAGERLMIYNPVPYNLEFEMTVLAKTMDDALQITEQILPLFAPTLSVDIEFMEQFPSESIPIALSAVTPQQPEEIGSEETRLINFVFNLTMKINYHIPRQPRKIITKVTDNFNNIETLKKFKTYEMTADNLIPVTDLETRGDEPTTDIITDHDPALDT